MLMLLLLLIDAYLLLLLRCRHVFRRSRFGVAAIIDFDIAASLTLMMLMLLIRF